MPAPRTRTAGVLLLAVGLFATIVGTVPAGAAEAPVGLGTVGSFAVLGGSTVTNTGPSVISGDVGVSPGTEVTGFPPGTVNSGTMHVTDAVAAQAQLDLTDAYDDAAGRSPTAAVTADLAGQTLVAGVYSGPTLALTGSLTLDAQGDPDAVFIFQAESTLVTGSASVVALANGAQACNVFWQVGSSATLGTGSTFVGSVLALTSVTATTGASVDGRLLARNGAVTLDSNTITRSTCATDTTTTTSGATGSTPTAPGTGTDGSGALPVGGGTDAPDDGLPGDDGGTPGGGTPAGSAPGLPATGTGASTMTAVGLLAVAAGVAMLVGARRRTMRCG